MGGNAQSDQQNQGSLELGLFINNQYITVKKLGVGGFGVVWQAYDFSLRNFIAIKELLPEYAQPKFVEMFYKEALIAKNIIHDNIVRVQHFWQGSNGSFYVVLDYVRGVDLESLIRRCNDMNTVIPWKLSALIGMNVLKAIDYANRIARDSITGSAYGIVYRDISPGNVLLSFDGNVKLSDFGIAKTADEIRDSIPQKVITGKYPYMSPEQIKGLQDIDHRTDIFSIGVLFYEMLTGKQLYQGTNEEIKNQVLGQKFDPTTLFKADPSIHPELGDIISKALEKDRDSRYERAIEMYRDIRRVLKGVETDELTVELSDFIFKMSKDALAKSEKLIENVKNLDIGEIERNRKIYKITCNDFIVGQHANNGAATVMGNAGGMPSSMAAGTVAVADSMAGSGMPSQVQQQPRQFENVQSNAQQPAWQSEGEAKGKTVFEEVGDWLFKKFDNIKKDIIRVLIGILLALLIFAGIDVFFLQLTPFGKTVYSKLYPPDVVITTVPAGAVVSMKTKDGDVILNNVASNTPIPIRKVTPRTYIVTALKEGFRPVQRVVQIEQSDKSKKVRKEKIEIMFDFVLNVDSNPKGASVYVDGNKFGQTPCKVQLLAGPHTIKLSLDGFEDLGSNSKDEKAGHCNIDFTKTTIEDMFAGVDRKFWLCELKNIDGENIFSLQGDLFKKVRIVSDPPGMMVHIHGEGQPRGETPLNTLFKPGNYEIRFLDPSARYGEAVKELVVNPKTKQEVFVKMNKIVSFRVRAKENINEVFLTKVKIYNKNYSITKDISTSKPIRVPLPVDVYNILFYGDNEYKSTQLYNVDINSISSVVGELEYEKVALKLNIKSSQTGEALPNAYIWFNNKAIGRTDKNGIFETKLKAGKHEFKIVATGHEEQTCPINLIPGKKNSMDIVMKVAKADSDAGSPASKIEAIDLKNSAVPETNKDNSKIAEPATKTEPLVKKESKKSSKKKEETVSDNDGEEQEVLVCLNCGYVNTVPKGKKLRFCINCAKPLK